MKYCSLNLHRLYYVVIDQALHYFHDNMIPNS